MIWNFEHAIKMTAFDCWLILLARSSLLHSHLAGRVVYELFANHLTLNMPWAQRYCNHHWEFSCKMIDWPVEMCSSSIQTTAVLKPVSIEYLVAFSAHTDLMHRAAS